LYIHDKMLLLEHLDLLFRLHLFLWFWIFENYEFRCLKFNFLANRRFKFLCQNLLGLPKSEPTQCNFSGCEIKKFLFCSIKQINIDFKLIFACQYVKAFKYEIKSTKCRVKFSNCIFYIKKLSLNNLKSKSYQEKRQK
jgi:hypothetical protein